VTDLAPSSGIKSVTARIAVKVRCKNNERRMCTKTIRIKGRRVAGMLFSVSTPKLRRGTYRLRVSAADRAGNTQRVPTGLRFRVR
jgi:hypothetical protein